jgi:hypothetical protein
MGGLPPPRLQQHSPVHVPLAAQLQLVLVGSSDKAAVVSPGTALGCGSHVKPTLLCRARREGCRLANLRSAVAQSHPAAALHLICTYSTLPCAARPKSTTPVANQAWYQWPAAASTNQPTNQAAAAAAADHQAIKNACCIDSPCGMIAALSALKPAAAPASPSKRPCAASQAPLAARL